MPLMWFLVRGVHERFGVTDRMVFPITLERLVTAEGIGVVDRSLAGVALDVAHQLLGRDRLNDLGVNPPIALQEPENNALSGRPAPALAFAPPAEVGLVEFDLALQFPGFELGEVEERFAQPLVDSTHPLHIDPEVLGQPVGRHPLVEALQDRDLTAQTRETFAATAATTLHVATGGAHDLERTAEHTLLCCINICVT